MDLKISRTLKSSLLYVMVLIFLGFILLPYVWQFLTSIKPLAEISAIPAKWVPSKINVEYYFNVFQKHPFARYLFNSVIVATMTTVVSILIGASASYALARLRFKGKKSSCCPS
ncbi:hypothetical protein HMSSN036_17790 [Paenibacillus macerans]|nr:hypothetical protein HMSSN036_17790 [Paenibacillus macerans]